MENQKLEGKLKHLFVARHGDYRADGRLNYDGCQQMKVLGEAIKGILKGNSVHIISSTAPRAVESSQILMAELALPEFERSQYLWSGSDQPDDGFLYGEKGLGRLLNLVHQKKERARGLVLVTHQEVTTGFPHYFLEKEFGQDEYIPDISRNSTPRISKGEALHLDLEGRTYQILPHKNVEEQ